MKEFQKIANWRRSIVCVLLLVVLGTGCASETPTPVAEEDFNDVEITPVDAQTTDEAAVVSESDVAEVNVVETAVSQDSTDECLACHVDQEMLMATADPEEEVINENVGESHWGEVTPRASWEKVLVDSETYPKTVHGQIACQDCHGGVQSPDKAVAHEGLIKNPSSDPQSTCGGCHPDVVAMNEFSLHTNLTGFQTVLNERS
ncbi:MAG: hypothetical protein P8183_06880, partial [Anaerolineae bacterium]